MICKCPNCQQEYEVDANLVGSEAECTACGKRFVVSMPNVGFAAIESSTEVKTLKCDMCGSTDLIKQDGVFVCQYCHTKYSIEEAKKMMFSGNINVTGTVKVDKTDSINNDRVNARKALSRENWRDVVKYYSRIVDESPGDVEASVLKALADIYLDLLNLNIVSIQEVAYHFQILTQEIAEIPSGFSNSAESEQTLQLISGGLRRLMNVKIIGDHAPVIRNSKDITKNTFIAVLKQLLAAYPNSVCIGQLLESWTEINLFSKEHLTEYAVISGIVLIVLLMFGACASI